MHGSFGPTQGVKMPTLNKGKSNELIVLFWSASKLIVKIPGNFPPGMYKTGVYCSDPCAPGVGINTSGMVWRDFEVLSNLKISDPPVLKKKK
ncbi:MAG: hypothetical protein GY707_12495 [Desulfobacteraceae bacterium]|nr:hypothetical protein [Desulfobacteraceae bacterium]